MAIRAALARTLLTCALLGGATIASAPAAQAQHVVTDEEAGKLTFDALTAVPRPLVHRVIAYHTVSWHRGSTASAWNARTIRGVQTVAFRHRFSEPAGFAGRAVSHRRRRG